MKISISRGIAIGALLCATALPALAQDEPTFEIKEYRIETDDCFGCGPMIAQSESELQSLLEETSAILEDRRFGDGVYAGGLAVGPSRVRRPGRPSPQVVFLDFDAGGEPTFPVCFTDGTLFGVFEDHVYTQAERDEIQARIEADYAPFNFSFTQDEPLSGDFTTILFGQNDAPLDCSEGSNISLTPTGGISILFGMADGIDFLNEDKNDTAFADPSVWEFLAQLGGADLFESLSGVSVADFGGDLTAALSFAVVNQSANTGAHEAGHIQGLRHQNSFGAPGEGIPDTGAILPTDFVPVFDGPVNASETVLHTMASGASVGLALEGSTITDRFFSERSAVRLAINEQGRIDTEAAAVRRRGFINLRNIRTPNTIIEGQNEDARLAVRGLVVDGEISTEGEADSYFFIGRAGDFFNAEIIPVIVTGETFEEGILGQVSIFLQNADGSETLVATNARSFESLFDTEIFDAVLPETGKYRVEVSAPDVVFIDVDGDGLFDAVPLSLAGGAELLAGNYRLLLFTCDKRLPASSRRSFASAQ